MGFVLAGDCALCGFVLAGDCAPCGERDRDDEPSRAFCSALTSWRGASEEGDHLLVRFRTRPLPRPGICTITHEKGYVNSQLRLAPHYGEPPPSTGPVNNRANHPINVTK